MSGTPPPRHSGTDSVKRGKKLPIEDEWGRQLSLEIWLETYEKERPTEEQLLDDYIKGRITLHLQAWERAGGITIPINAKEQLEHIFKCRNQGARRKATEAALRGTKVSWGKIRRLVWERDGGICHVCQEEIDWEYYHTGHMVDRCVGGSDRPSNLVVMCNLCNLKLKCLTPSKQAYFEWLEQARQFWAYYRARDTAGCERMLEKMQDADR
jgi:hypothetical protein